MKKAFTLIELLIVVAIIAILAAIAVPNFLEAQTRAKISRTRADMRTIATALETYKIDVTKYPVDGGGRAGALKYPNQQQDTIVKMFGSFRLNNMITTPIAYLTTSIYDVFMPKTTIITEQTFRYYDWKGALMEYHGSGSPQPAAYGLYQARSGEWQLLSQGPDKKSNIGPAGNGGSPYLFSQSLPYDSTNGTVSPGDIVRTQARGEGYTFP